MKMRSIVIVLVSIVIHSTTGQNWNYGDKGPAVWSDTYETCAGRSQSPINIRTACTTYQALSSFRFSSSYDRIHSFILTNTGYTITGKYNGNDSSLFQLTGGGLQETFEFVDFHLHWGENYRSGSEHPVNGVKYAGEIHFVHKNPETSELAVLGFFMQSNQDTTLSEMKNQSNEISGTTNTTNNEWRKYFTAAVTLRAKDNSIVVSLNLASLMGSNLHDFWRYQGSLTTPPCTEGVIWTVFKTPILFNESKIIVFRKDLFLEGYRGPQPLYNRIVYRNFLNETLSLIPDDNCCPNSSNHFSNQIALIYFLLFWLNK